MHQLAQATAQRSPKKLRVESCEKSCLEGCLFWKATLLFWWRFWKGSIFFKLIWVRGTPLNGNQLVQCIISNIVYTNYKSIVDKFSRWCSRCPNGSFWWTCPRAELRSPVEHLVNYPWQIHGDEWYIYLHAWLIFDGKLTGKYTVCPMDPMGYIYILIYINIQ